MSKASDSSEDSDTSDCDSDEGWEGWDEDWDEEEAGGGEEIILHRRRSRAVQLFFSSVLSVTAWFCSSPTDLASSCMHMMPQATHAGLMCRLKATHSIFLLISTVAAPLL